MKFLVISDSHGDCAAIVKAFATEQNINAVVHLGDGAMDTDMLKIILGSRPLFQVRGNCDHYSEHPTSEVFTVEEKLIFYTHGHKYRVKEDLSGLRRAAITEDADIVLYGHTHRPDCVIEDEVWYCNPGSVEEGNYAVLEIDKAKGITWQPRRVYD